MTSLQVYRTVLDYYSSGQDSEEDAYDMRKALSRDKDKRSMIPLTVNKMTRHYIITILNFTVSLILLEKPICLRV